MTAGKLLLAWLAAVNLALLILMGADKARSKRRGARRTPEAELMLLALLGGALGGTLGMLLFRHKTRHAAFAVGFPVILAAQAAIAFFIIKLAA